MAEKRKAIFLDKDGTLIPDVPYNVNPDLITLEDGVIEGLQLLKNHQFIFVVISNQAGVARGYFDIKDLVKVEEKLNLLLNKEGINVEGYYFCPHHLEGKIAEYAIDCDCRKPKPGMILQAAKELDIDTTRSWMIGDILNDIEAGSTAGCKTILIDNGNETEWLDGAFRKPTYVAKNFLKAANFICSNTNETPEVNDKKLAAL